MVGFYSIHNFVHFAFLSNLASAGGIAVIHSVFNIGCAIVLFPFANQLVKLATLTVRTHAVSDGEKPIAVELAALDERFLDSPSFAIQLCKKAVIKMAEYSEQSILLAMEVHTDYSAEKVEEVIRLEQLVDQFEDSIGTYLVKLATKDLGKEDSHLLSVLLHSISDFERISDHAINITEAAQKMKGHGLVFTGKGKKELDALGVAVRDIMTMTRNVFSSDDTEGAANVEPLEEVIDDLVMEMKQRHISRLRRGDCSMEAGLLLEDVLTNYERVSDHCSNIAAAMIEISADELDMHRYTHTRVQGGNEHFQGEYMRLKDVYVLP